MNIYDESLRAHKKVKGKLEIKSKVSIDSTQDLSIVYSPGVGAVSKHIFENPDDAPHYTNINNSVAVISDGSSVLGLGNIGALAALPVMEGKAVLFKQFANIDAYPIVLGTQEPDEIITAITAIAPSFGGINLEDIAAPQCFYIENELKKRLAMPIMHDDQHGTAIVVLAGLVNACKVIKKPINTLDIVIIGAGAAGNAIAKLLNSAGAKNIVVVDSKGAIHTDRGDTDKQKQMLATFNKTSKKGSLTDVISGSDVVIGVSRAGLITPSMVKSMAEDSIVFALANPEPEIYPNEAIEAGAKVVATGRSDFPNQVNNVLAFPGLFRGALDTSSRITEEHKLKAAYAIAAIVENPTSDEIIPSVFNKKVVQAVSSIFST
jgi:malate dehydrogenase (oxaloacetate-decarboxylating)